MSIKNSDLEAFDFDLSKALNDSWKIIGEIRSANTWEDDYSEVSRSWEVTHFVTLQREVVEEDFVTVGGHKIYLPRIQGSRAQVSWARNIRFHFSDAMLDYIKKTDRVSDAVTVLVRTLESVNSSGWWIDTKDESCASIIDRMLEVI